MNHRLGICLLLAFGVMCIARPTMAIGLAPAWKPRQIVSASAQGAFHDGSDRILAYDHWGNPGIVFQASPLDDLMYARLVPGGAPVWWTTSMVEFIPRWPLIAMNDP
jgi:hypothetical protein